MLFLTFPNSNIVHLKENIVQVRLHVPVNILSTDDVIVKILGDVRAKRSLMIDNGCLMSVKPMAISFRLKLTRVSIRQKLMSKLCVLGLNVDEAYNNSRLI